jgi:hypothetical protein
MGEDAGETGMGEHPRYRLVRSEAQARRVAHLAALVRSGRYTVPSMGYDGSPLRGYRAVRSQGA